MKKLPVLLHALRIAVAREDGEARILRKAGIGAGEIAKDKNGAAIRRDLTGVETLGAKAYRLTRVR